MSFFVNVHGSCQEKATTIRDNALLMLCPTQEKWRLIYWKQLI